MTGLKRGNAGLSLTMQVIAHEESRAPDSTANKLLCSCMQSSLQLSTRRSLTEARSTRFPVYRSFNLFGAARSCIGSSAFWASHICNPLHKRKYSVKPITEILGPPPKYPMARFWCLLFFFFLFLFFPLPFSSRTRLMTPLQLKDVHPSLKCWYYFCLSVQAVCLTPI
ncbi:hypothetical protein CC78DRAFT_203552 [Lojkania enalia]|uniref:Uncharacterized protein n=1 Tax=Lojkania enalia TaxID=147567 RepID=A0A9P4N0U2_9PLEO|nr:hypothetical protein CC78DRAFT_203552 [Didymosphaeria enalia]